MAERLEEKLRELKVKEEARLRIKKCYIEKARIRKGLEDIVSSPQKLLEFAEATVAYGSFVLNDSRVRDMEIRRHMNNSYFVSGGEIHNLFMRVLAERFPNSGTPSFREFHVQKGFR